MTSRCHVTGRGKGGVDRFAPGRLPLLSASSEVLRGPKRLMELWGRGGERLNVNSTLNLTLEMTHPIGWLDGISTGQRPASTRFNSLLE